jgi:hypothetical protein
MLYPESSEATFCPGCPASFQPWDASLLGAAGILLFVIAYIYNYFIPAQPVCQLPARAIAAACYLQSNAKIVIPSRNNPAEK